MKQFTYSPINHKKIKYIFKNNIILDYIIKEIKPKKNILILISLYSFGKLIFCGL